MSGWYTSISKGDTAVARSVNQLSVRLLALGYRLPIATLVSLRALARADLTPRTGWIIYSSLQNS
jgi:hypothetical protein